MIIKESETELNPNTVDITLPINSDNDFFALVGGDTVGPYFYIEYGNTLVQFSGVDKDRPIREGNITYLSKRGLAVAKIMSQPYFRRKHEEQ